jgi:hypothetical protein
LLKEKWYLPYLDTSVRALPYHYRDTIGQENDLIKFTFRGEQDKCWLLSWQHQKWILYYGEIGQQEATSEVIIKDTLAWKIFTKGVDRSTAMALSDMSGNRKLGEKIFDLVAIMA